MSNQQISIIILSDQTLSREGLNSLLSKCDDLDLIGQLSSHNFTIDYLHAKKPNVLLIDCYLQTISAEQISRQVLKHEIPVKIIAINHIIDEQHFLTLLDAGVRGYLLSSDSSERIINGIREVVDGQVSISAHLTKFLMKPDQSPNEFSTMLTSREIEVLVMMAEGYSNTQIAELLCISVGTVKNHIKNIYKKMDVHTRVEALLSGLQHGLVRVRHSP